MHSRKSRIIFFFLFLSSLIFNITTSDDAKDKEECTNEVVGLATCLPYVEGLANAKAPTPDCCSGLKELLKTNKMCLCLVVKHRNDPDLGLNINATLALGLPSVCHLQANATECPDLLHLDPKSPEAQIFYNYGNSTSKNVSRPASSPIPTGGSGAPRPRVEAQKSNSDHSGKRWFKGEAIIMTILLLCYYVSF